MKKVLLVLIAALMLSVGCHAYEVWNWDMIGHMPEIAVDKYNYGPRLILSDNPETTAQFGVLYQDYVYGSTRLFMHHVNAATKPAHAVAVLLNDSDAAVTVEVTKHVLSGPGYDYSLIGKEVNRKYFSFNHPYQIVAPPHGGVVLDKAMLKKQLVENQLVTGMYDFNVRGKLLLKTVMLPAGADAVQWARAAVILDKENEHPRGTFPGADRAVFFQRDYNPHADGLCALTLADGVIDKFQVGVDAITGEKVVNYGNYGVVYRLFVLAAEEQPFNIYLNPWGGTYGGVLAWRPGADMGWETIDTPKGQTVFAENTIYHVEPVTQSGSGLVGQILFSPPGAANLPVKLLFMPPDFDLQKYAAANKAKAK